MAALALFGALRTWSETDRAARESQDVYQLAARQQLLEAGLADVPQAARVGFFSDLGPGTPAGTALLFATQYAAAPRLLVEEGAASRPEWWLGCFSKPLDFEAEGRRRGLKMVRDLGGGTVLYRGEAK